MNARKVSRPAAPKGKPKAYSYLRFSTPEQMKGDSLRRQSEAADAFALRHGLELDRELNLQDLGVSAFRGMNASAGALSIFLRAVQDGLIDSGSVLILESLDRLSRQGAWDTMPTLQLLLNAGVRLGFPPERIVDVETIRSNPFVLMEMMLIMIRAREESEIKSRRLKAAWVGKRGKLGDGKALTAITPGWIKLNAERRPVLIHDRANVVRRMVRWALEGTGKHMITRRLNEEGVKPFGRATMWRNSSVRKLLTSPALMGTFVPHTEEHKDGKLIRNAQPPVPDYFPAVIDRDTFDRLQSIVDKSPLRGRHAVDEVRNLLSGIGRCAWCGSTVTRVWKGQGTRPRLVCTRAKTGAGCDYASVILADVESALVERGGELAGDAPAPDAAAELALHRARAAYDGVDGRLSSMLEVLERAPSEALGQRVAAIEVEAKAARETLEAAEDAARQAETRLNAIKTRELAKALTAQPLDRRRANAALRALVREVAIDPGTGTMAVRWHLGGETSVAFAFPADDAAEAVPVTKTPKRAAPARHK